MLTRIQLTTDDDGLVPTTEQSSDENDDEWVRGTVHICIHTFIQTGFQRTVFLILDYNVHVILW